MKKKGLFLVFAVIVTVAVLSVFAAACDTSEGGTFAEFTVNFYSESELVKSVTVDAADFDFASAIPEAPEKSGEEGKYVFSHWQFVDGTPLSADNYPTKDADLFAVYELESKTYTVTFKGFDGGYLAVNGKYSQTIEEGKAAVAPVAPEVEGYEFKGWDKDFDDVRENLTVNAVYEAKSYTLTFTDGKNVVNSEQVAFGTALDEYTEEGIEKDGLTFFGWKSADGETYYDMPAKNLTMVAEWKVNSPVGVSLISSAESAVYGEGITFTLSYTQYEDLEYSVRWLVGGTVVGDEGDTFLLKQGAGTYKVKATVTANYDGASSSVSTQEIKVEIAKKDLIVTPVVSDVVYGESYIPSFLFEGFIDGEDESCLYGELRVNTNYYSGADAGDYNVSAVGMSSDDYMINTPTVTLTVVKRPLTVSVAPATATYGDDFESPEYTVEGLYVNDAVEGVTLSCDYPSVNKNAGVYDITASGLTFASGKAENYDIKYTKSTLTVNKKAATAKLNGVDDVVYLSEAPGLTYTVSGLIDGDNESALGTVSTVCDYAAGDDVGEYRAYLEIEGESVNYEVTLQNDAQSPVKFSVTPYDIKFEGVAIKDNRYDGNAWESTVDKFVTELPDGFTAEGAIKALTKATGDYTLPGDEDKFAITLAVLNAEGEDCTGNFSVTYSFTLTVGETVNMTVQNYEYDYTGEPQGGGVTVADEGYTAEYLNGGVYTSSYPTFTDAGEYTVEFRVIDNGGAVVLSSSYKVTVNKIDNTVNTDGVTKVYTYNGSVQTVSGAVALYEEAAVTYENNTFTDVPDGGVLTVTAIAAETKNYKETRVSFTVTVNKADYTEEQIPELEIEVQAEPGKTLEGIAAPENCTWHNAAAVSLVVGEQSVDASYCADSRNYNAKSVSVKVVGIKTAIAIVSSDVSVPFGTDYAPQYSFTKNSVAFDPSTVGLILTVKADTTTFAVGSTYKVTLSLDDNEWYTAPDKTVTVKVPTVLYGGAYYTIEDALKLVQSNESFIIVAYDTSFATPDVAADVYPDDSYYTLSSGENLLVPYSEAHSTDTGDIYATTGSSVTKNNAYATLYIPSGITFDSSGFVYVSAARNSNSANPTGNAAGKYGVLNIAEGAKFISGGTFECSGFAIGDGLIEITGGKLYEPMIAIGYKGGNITNAINSKVFPINQYTLNNIMTDMKVYSSVSYFAKTVIKASSNDVKTDVEFMGSSSDEFMQLTDGYIMKSYNDNTGKVSFEVSGSVSFNDMTLTLGGVGSLSVTVSTSGKQVPLPGYFDFTIKSGSTATVNAGVKLLPGSSFTVESGATLNVKSNVFVYTRLSDEYFDKSDQYSGMADSKKFSGWQDGGNAMAYPHASAKDYYYTSVTFDFNASTPAELNVYGTLIVGSGAKIAGGITLGEGGKIQLDSNAATENTITEDHTDYEDNTKFFGKVISVKAHYFYSTASAYYINGGNEVALEKGRTYTATASGVTVS